MADQNKKSGILLPLLGALAAVLIVCMVLAATMFVTRTIDIEGCVNSSASSVNDAVTALDHSNNSLFLFYQLNLKDSEEKPAFVSDLKLKFASPWHVRIMVEEEVLSGCVLDETSGYYYYFGPNGKICEITTKIINDIPVVEGISVSNVQVGDDLPTKPESARGYLLSILSQISQLDLQVSSAAIDEDGGVSVTVGSIVIHLGQNENTESKLSRLELILPQLSGKKGEIDLSAWKNSDDDIIFREEE